jgi:branched-chain amino acid transport system substrate-binding protein
MLLDGGALAVQHWNVRREAGPQAVLVHAADDAIWGSATEVADLAYRERVAGIVGGYGAESTHVAEQVAVKARVPLIAPATSDPSLTQVGIPWMFCLMPDDEAFAQALVQWLGSRGVSLSIGILASDAYDDRVYAQEIVQAAGPVSISIAWKRFYPSGSRTAEFEILPVALCEDLDYLIFLGGPETSAGLIENLRERVACPIIFGPRFSWTLKDRAAFRFVGNGFVQSPCNWWALSEARDQFVADFKAEYESPPTMLAGYAYDSVMLLLDAYARSDGTRAGILRQMTAGDLPRPGVTGPIVFDGSGMRKAKPLLFDNQGKPVWAM